MSGAAEQDQGRSVAKACRLAKPRSKTKGAGAAHKRGAGGAKKTEGFFAFVA